MRAKAAWIRLRIQIRIQTLHTLAALLILLLCVQQTAIAAGPQDQTPMPAASPSAAVTITVPSGRAVPLTLVSPIKSKSTRVGDPVRAVVAFPINVGDRVAIPAGTYVEGVVTALTAHMKKTHLPDVQIHFTRLLYANGYTATLDAANTQARYQAPTTASPILLAQDAGLDSKDARPTRIAFYGGEGFRSRAQASPTPPTLPPLPQVGPSKALVFGIVGGVTAALLTLAIVFGHRGNNADYVLFDAGWQFQMALASPLGVDAAQVAAASSPAR